MVAKFQGEEKRNGNIQTVVPISDKDVQCENN